MDGLWGDESRHVVIETLYCVKTGSRGMGESACTIIRSDYSWYSSARPLLASRRVFGSRCLFQVPIVSLASPSFTALWSALRAWKSSAVQCS